MLIHLHKQATTTPRIRTMPSSALRLWSLPGPL